jgi:putative ABC transport system permease protein
MIQIFKLIIASYKHNILRSALVFLAMLVACAGLSAVLIINATAKQSYASASQPFLSNVEHRVVAKSGKKISKKDYASLRNMGFNQLIGVQRQYEDINVPPNRDDQKLRLVGIDTFALLSLPKSSSNSSLMQNTSFKLSELWRPPYPLIIHPKYASELNLIAGQSLTLSNGSQVGLLSVQNIQGLGREIVMDIGALHFALGQSELSELLVVGTGVSESDSRLITRIETVLPNHLQLESLNTGAQAQQLTSSFHLNLLAMAMLMFVVCMFVVMNALHLLLIKRWHNFRIARQLGVSTRQVYAVLLIELMVLSLICAPIGTLIGALLAQFLSPQVNQTLQGLFAVRVAYNDLSYGTLMLQSLFACLVGAIAAAILPFWQLKHRLTLRTLPSYGHTKQKLTKNLLWLIAAAIFSTITFTLAWLSTSLFTSFVAIAFLIFAGCSLLIFSIPPTLSGLGKMLPQSQVLWRWTFADSVRLSQRSKIACCAFFIAVASNVGMNLMVDSFRQATEQWLAQRLIADEYVRTSNPEEFAMWVDASGTPVEVFPRENVQAQLLRNDNSVYKTPTSFHLSSYPINMDYQQAMLFENVEDKAWQKFKSGAGILVNQQFALKQNLSLGDMLSFSTGALNIEDKVIVGIYYDYGNQRAEALLPLDKFATIDSKTSSFAVHFSNAHEQQQFHNAFSANNFKSPTQKINTAELLARSMQTFDRTFVITDSLNIVTLLVAALSLATSVLMIDMDNRPQRTLMRSMGVSEARLSALSLSQYALLTLFSCALALPFGICLSWLLINLINVQAFYWSYPLFVEPLKLLWVCLSSLLLVLFVVVLPLYRLSRRRLIEDIKCLSF